MRRKFEPIKNNEENTIIAETSEENLLSPTMTLDDINKSIEDEEASINENIENEINSSNTSKHSNISLREKIQNECINRTSRLCKKLYGFNFTKEQYKSIYKNLYPTVSKDFFTKLNKNISLKDSSKTTTYYIKESVTKKDEDVSKYLPLPVKEEKFLVKVIKKVLHLLTEIFADDKKQKEMLKKSMIHKKYTLSYASKNLQNKFDEYYLEKIHAELTIQSAVRDIKGIKE